MLKKHFKINVIVQLKIFDNQKLYEDTSISKHLIFGFWEETF
jgi:hypothetical protein